MRARDAGVTDSPMDTASLCASNFWESFKSAASNAFESSCIHDGMSMVCKIATRPEMSASNFSDLLKSKTICFLAPSAQNASIGVLSELSWVKMLKLCLEVADLQSNLRIFCTEASSLAKLWIVSSNHFCAKD